MQTLRKEHITVVKESEPVLPVCEKASVPGVITQRSCPFHGARWFLAPIKDVIHLVHGVVGCAYYGQTVRGQDYQLASTDLNEINIISGSEKKLYHAIIEVIAAMPLAKAVLVYATCSTGLIGDDLAAVCRQAAKDSGKKVVAVDCPGFSGVSQGQGHDLSARVLLEHFIGKEELPDPSQYDVNLLGEFDVRGDAVVIKKLLGRLGIRVICTFTGDANVSNMGWSYQAKLNILHCRRTGKILAEEMKTKYGIPWRKVSFFGLQETSQSLRDIAAFFGLEEKAEQIIAAEEQLVNKQIARFKRYLNGKRVALYLGGSRMGSMVKAYRDLGMEIIMTGSQFGCDGDYQEAATKVKASTVLIDNASEKEIYNFLSKHRPHLFVGSTKEKFSTHKLGLPFLIFPQQSKPFAAYAGFVNFAREIFGLLNSPVWRFIAKDREVVEAMKVAVASKDGLYVDSHFGNASQFMIFEIDNGTSRLLEVRANTFTGGGGCNPGVKDLLGEVINLLDDCKVIICQKIGSCALDQLVNKGIKVIESSDSVLESISTVGNEVKRLKG